MTIHAPTVALVATAVFAFGGLTAINVVHTAAHKERQAVISELHSDVDELTAKTDAAEDAAETAATAEVEIRVLITEQDTAFSSTEGFLE